MLRHALKAIYCLPHLRICDEQKNIIHSMQPHLVVCTLATALLFFNISIIRLYLILLLCSMMSAPMRLLLPLMEKNRAHCGDCRQEKVKGTSQLPLLSRDDGEKRKGWRKYHEQCRSHPLLSSCFLPQSLLLINSAVAFCCDANHLCVSVCRSLSVCVCVADAAGSQFDYCIHNTQTHNAVGFVFLCDFFIIS